MIQMVTVFTMIMMRSNHGKEVRLATVVPMVKMKKNVRVNLSAVSASVSEKIAVGKLDQVKYVEKEKTSIL